jgi:hypothetical protein
MSRPRRPKLRAGTAVGRALRVIYQTAMPYFSDEEFREHLNELLQDGTVLLVAQACEVRKIGPVSETRSRHFFQKIQRVRSDMSLLASEWILSRKWTAVDPGRSRSYMHYVRPCLYVVADGLPYAVARFVGTSGVTRGERVMASLQHA